MHALIITIIIIAVVFFLARHAFHKKSEGFSEFHQVVLVYSKSCPHCIHFMPIFEKYKHANVHVNMIAIDAATPEGTRFSKMISGYPTTIIIDQNNNMIGKPLVGATSYEILAEYVQSNY